MTSTRSSVQPAGAVMVGVPSTSIDASNRSPDAVPDGRAILSVVALLLAAYEAERKLTCGGGGGGGVFGVVTEAGSLAAEALPVASTALTV